MFAEKLFQDVIYHNSLIICNRLLSLKKIEIILTVILLAELYFGSHLIDKI